MTIFTSKRFWTALIIIIGLFFLRLHPYLIMPLLFGIAILFNAKTIYPLKNYKFWIVILFLVLIVPIFTGIQDKSFIGINYSDTQLQKTMFMTMRGLSIFLLFQVLTIDLNIEKIKPIFSKIGIKNFEELFNLSIKIFPKIKSILNARYTQFKTTWKINRSIELVLNSIGDIFTDFFQLSDQLSKTENTFEIITPSDFFKQNKLLEKPSLIVVVGDAGTGKTPWVEQLINLLKSKNETVDGIISSKRSKSDEVWYHDLIRISTNKKRQLTTMDEIDTEIRIGKFNLYKSSITWGNEQLISIVNSDWVIVDEVGILEFDGGGFLPGLQSVVKNLDGYLVITVRPTLFQHLDNFLTEQLSSLKHWNRHIVELYSILNHDHMI